MSQKVINAGLSISMSGSISDDFSLHVPNSGFSISNSLTLSNGVGDNQVNYIWAKEGKMGKSGSNTIDVYGTEEDIYGNLMLLSTLKVLIIKNTSTDKYSVLRVTTNGIGFITGTTPYLEVRPGSFTVVSSVLDGWEVTAGSADTITITNIGTEDGATYELMIAGVKIDESSSLSSFSSASSSSSSPLKSSSSSSSSSS